MANTTNTKTRLGSSVQAQAPVWFLLFVGPVLGAVACGSGSGSAEAALGAVAVAVAYHDMPESGVEDAF